MVAAIGVSACSSGEEVDQESTPPAETTSSAASPTPSPSTSDDSALPVNPAYGLPILIETRMENIRKGEVLPGSFLADEPFCPGGTVRTEHGSPDIGLVQATYVCSDGRLNIGYSPMQVSEIQSSSWQVIDGSGRYEGFRGQGWMVARFDDGSGKGRETITGTVEGAN